jgi:hypothetical protein
LGAIEAGEPRPVEKVVEETAVAEEVQQVEVEELDEEPVAEEAELTVAAPNAGEMVLGAEAEAEIEAEIEVEHADSAYAIDVDREIDEPSPAETQVIPRSDVETALRGGQEQEQEQQRDEEPFKASMLDEQEPSPQSTQLISRDIVEAAIRGAAEVRVVDEPTSGHAMDQEPVADDEMPAVESESAASDADTKEESAASIWDLEQSSQTLRLPRDEIDAALARGEGTSADGEPEVEIISYEGMADDTPGLQEPDEGWTPPSDLEQIISCFNAKHRVVYRTVRAEVGAGAANFIRACCDPESAQAEALSGAELQSDGSWDAESLRRAVHENRIRDPRSEYERLIAVEIATLRSHISEAKVLELERQIDNVDRAEA